MKINKKKILISLTIISVISLAFIFYKINKNNNANTPSGEKFAQDIEIPNYFEGETLKTENNIKESDFDFPSSLPYLSPKRNSNMSEQTIIKIATDLGFTADPLKVTDIENGQIWIWEDEEYSLMITPKNNNIELSSSKSFRASLAEVTNNELSESDYKTVAEDFLVNRVGIAKTNLNFSGFLYFNSESSDEHLEESSSDNFQVVQLNFSQGSSNYKITSGNSKDSPISVRLMKDGKVLSSNIIFGTSYDKSINEYPIKNYDEFTQKISEAILVSLDGGNLNIPDIESSDIKNIVLNEVSISYLLDSPSQQVLQPIFLIKGKATISGLNSEVEAVLYIPAFR